MSEDRGKLLLVDDDPKLLQLLSIRLEAAGYALTTADSATRAMQLLPSANPQLVITDLRMAGMDGMDLLEAVHQRRPGLPVLIITAHGTIPDAVAATQRGAFGFLTKPVDKDALLEQVERALKLSTAVSDEHHWRSAIITRSQVMEELLAQARQVALTDSSVLITGASGTGKELLAQAIHRASARRQAPFVAINCGAIPAELLESELFGHRKGAFTGANRDHTGLFQAAQEGTVFLDEIGDMPLSLQVKLLRVLQEREIRPVGDTRAIPVNVRVLSATHRDLGEAMAEDRFREDLYYRLNVVHLHLPTLAERRDDIPPLVGHALERLAARGDGVRKVYAPEAMELLVSAQWPGNIRQLFNVVEQNVALSPSPVIGPSLVQKALGQDPAAMPSFNEARDEFTRNYLIQLMQITQGNVTQAARLAKRNRTDLYKLLNRHQVDPADYKDA